VRRGIAAAVVTAALAAQPLGAETIDRVLAIVGGQMITLTDVTAARDLGLQTAGAAADPVRVILSQLIDRELVLNEVDRYAPPEPTAAAVDRELDRVRARFASPEAFGTVLAQSGIDESHVREIVRQNLRIREYQDQRFSPADPRSQTAIGQWIAGLRRRGNVIDLYLSGP
jgi:hypothetical protein